MNKKIKIENLESLYDAFISHNNVVINNQNKELTGKCYFTYGNDDLSYGLFKEDSANNDDNFFPSFVIEEKRVDNKYEHRFIQWNYWFDGDEEKAKKVFNEYLLTVMDYNKKKIKTKDFEIKNGYVNSYLGNQENIVIPSEVEGISALADEDRNLPLKSIIITPGVKYIVDYAFLGCEDLKQVVIPYTITHIGEEVFMGCKKLEKIFYLGTEKYLDYFDMQFLSVIDSSFALLFPIIV